MVQLLWKIVWCFLKNLNTELPLPDNSSLECIYKRSENRDPDIYSHVRGSIIHINQKVEITLVFTDGQLLLVLMD